MLGAVCGKQKFGIDPQMFFITLFKFLGDVPLQPCFRFVFSEYS